MMYIVDGPFGINCKPRQWHVGDSVDALGLTRRVISFQVDGDELDMILNAMKCTVPELTSNAGKDL